ncbi:MAG: bifunctional hydroxymethylpyrimidine kinase/phosphomethylpyrimidine kinase [bacterium]|nr:bifunctional hydroxymethylpyrimidine kinase/phosphomethylpyrimidine kinase [bacterium]
MIRNVLSIAGSDPSGGAGIQADIKAISANGAYAMAALTALTAQNTRGVRGVHVVPPEFVRDQITAVFADVRVDAVKIGMIATAEIATAIAMALTEAVANVADVPIVLDPVMIAKGGAPLLADDAVTAVREQLLPLATVLTPNLPEAARLLETTEALNRDQMAAHAQQLCDRGPRAVLLKGGHLTGDTSPDCLASGGQLTWFEADRTDTPNTHGTGCTLSAALAAQLACDRPLATAVGRAKTFVARAIAGADELDVGGGHGPTHHFVDLW